MTSLDFSKKSLIFITGASRGIGRALAIEMSQSIHPQSALVLIASSASALEETKSLVLQVESTLNVVTYPIDLSEPSDDVYEKLFDEVIKKVDVSNLDYSIFIHNAGTIGCLKKTVDLNDVELWRKYYDLNLISAISLNSKFISKTKGLAKKLFIVNITSLCGRVPFVNMSMYGSCKAARELFFKVLAVEESNLTILNYSPGPVATDMFETIIETAEDDGLRKSFKETKKTDILTPQKTVKMLLDILKKGIFESGQTIDYFDLVKST
ncbi:sepiapterin reductase-like isoform X1 [Harmonia axyridis]|uniref:sepiapterin reductase-like isoform X1 n=1 Tax=Harmonia axyridis TaxID=115357 RepID=UPI001E2764BC|nr:sepiapterin reductase-like isoform X1 [Harmonia axyridis]